MSMYFVTQAFIYLALALIIGGAIGYAFRSCLADTACDSVRDDLTLANARITALLESQNAQLAQHVPTHHIPWARPKRSASPSAAVPNAARLGRAWQRLRQRCLSGEICQTSATNNAAIRGSGEPENIRRSASATVSSTAPAAIHTEA